MILGDILKGGVSKLLGGVKDLVGEFHLAPDKQLEFDAKLRELEVQESDTIVKAAESVLVAEATSDDGYVRRARPTFLYLVYAILLYSYLVRPAMGQPVLPLPEEIFWLFGSGILGYQGARSWEKKLGKA